MSAPPAILNKIKLLRNLANSPNPNEAETARSMAEQLMSKYNVTDADLEALEDKPLYGEDEKLFVTIGLSGWRQQLALAIATYFDCQIVVEELAIPNGDVSQFSYFVYGDPDQVKDVQFVYHAFSKKVDFLVEFRCMGRGPIYIDSYCEGVVESIKWNIQMEGIELPDVKRPARKVQEGPAKSSTQITKTTEEKAQPTENRMDVNKGSMIKDVMAYFKGLDDGKNISLQDVLELEVQNEEPQQIEQENES